MDETTFGLNYPIRACWMKRGVQKTIPAFSGKREYLHLIGAYNWRSDEVVAQLVEHKNSDTFIEFLEHLLITTYPDRAVILVMDNASYHYSTKVQSALSLFEHRVKVIWLPHYCPELNLIERFWLHLKNMVWVNHLYDALQVLYDRIINGLAIQNDPQASERLMFSKYFR